MKTVIDDRLEQIQQRSGFQFRLIEFNTLAAGAIISLALNKPQYWDALLLIPVISFSFFLLWVHHGIVIRLSNWEAPSKISFWPLMVILTFTLVILTNFLGIPIGAIVIHEFGYNNMPISGLLFIEIWILPVVTFIFFSMWVYLQFLKRSIPDGALTLEQDPK